MTMRDGQIISDEKKPGRMKASRPATATAEGTSEPALPAEINAPPSYAGSSGASWAFAWMVMTAAAEAIWRNKMRSALTMLGVFIGVAALIAMVSVGQGANEAVRKEIARLGTNLVVILPGAATSGGARGGSGSASTLTVADAQAIRRGGARRRRGELSHPPVGADPVCKPELDDQHPGRQPQLSPDDKLADRRRAGDHAGG